MKQLEKDFLVLPRRFNVCPRVTARPWGRQCPALGSWARPRPRWSAPSASGEQWLLSASSISEMHQLSRAYGIDQLQVNWIGTYFFCLFQVAVLPLKTSFCHKLESNMQGEINFFSKMYVKKRKMEERMGKWLLRKAERPPAVIILKTFFFSILTQGHLSIDF